MATASFLLLVVGTGGRQAVQTLLELLEDQRQCNSVKPIWFPSRQIVENTKICRGSGASDDDEIDSLLVKFKKQEKELTNDRDCRFNTTPSHPAGA